MSKPLTPIQEYVQRLCWDIKSCETKEEAQLMVNHVVAICGEVERHNRIIDMTSPIMVRVDKEMADRLTAHIV